MFLGALAPFDFLFFIGLPLQSPLPCFQVSMLLPSMLGKTVKNCNATFLLFLKSFPAFAFSQNSDVLRQSYGGSIRYVYTSLFVGFLKVVVSVTSIRGHIITSTQSNRNKTEAITTTREQK